MRRFGHQLIGSHKADFRQSTEICLESPYALIGVEHRVVVAVGRLHINVIAVDRHFVAGLEERYPWPHTQDHAGPITAENVIGQVVAFIPRTTLGGAFEKTERSAPVRKLPSRPY